MSLKYYLPSSNMENDIKRFMVIGSDCGFRPMADKTLDL